MCGHRGERWIKGAPVDRYCPETRTVFQYHGCYWHGCPKCYPDDRDKIIAHNDQTEEDKYQATKEIRMVGYRVVEAWACEVGDIDADPPKSETKIYPHAILYGFEACSDSNQRKDPTSMLTIENAHVPISVSVGDTFERDPTHICERDPLFW